ncbi:hypothetical protein BH18ACT16_BH18ACT16_07440 [soil metagenome]
MVRHLKVLTISMVFTTVAMGFAYALPSALRGAASQASEELEMVEEGEPTGEVAAQETEGDTGVESDDEGSEGESSEEAGGTAQGHNHGAVVSVAAHCSVKGRAHGELVREVARSKDMTVAEAEEACKAAVAAQEDGVKPGKHAKPEKPAKPGKPAKPAKPAKPDKPARPDKPAKPVKPVTPQPTKPNKPATPDKTATTGGSDKPDKPKKPH